jgi:hypothetical protein
LPLLNLLKVRKKEEERRKKEKPIRKQKKHRKKVSASHDQRKTWERKSVGKVWESVLTSQVESNLKN